MRTGDDSRWRDELVLAHLSAVPILARRVQQFFPRFVSLGDLIGAGELALVESATRYRPETGVRFMSFAQRRIVGAMYDSRRDDDVVPDRRALRGDYAAWCPVDDAAHMPAPGLSPEQALLVAAEPSDDAVTDAVRMAVAALPPRERCAIETLYLSGDTSRGAASALARQMGVHRSRVVQLRTAAFARLRVSLAPVLLMATPQRVQ